MKHLLWFVLALTCLKNAGAQCKLDYSNYHIVYEDYFTTTGPNAYTGIATGSHPLSSNYTLTHFTCYGGWGGDGGEYYDPGQVSFIPGGGVQLTAVKVPTVTCPTTGKTANYKSGMLRGINTYQYGMFEIQAKLYAKPNTIFTGWPTFWLATDPDLFEIDVFDGPNLNSATEMKTGIGNNVTNENCGRFTQHINAKLTDYNTYTCVWTPTRVSFFFNGREMYTTDNTQITFTPVHNRVYLTLQMCEYFRQNVDTSYYWIKSLKIYQANNDPNTDSYQSSKEFMNHNVFGDPGNGATKVSPDYRSIAVTSNNSSVFYRGIDNKLNLAKKTGTVWNIQSLSAPSSNALIGGDITYEKSNARLFYRSQDARLCCYKNYPLTTGWTQSYLDANFTTTDHTITAAPGSIAAAKNGDAYYIGWDNVIHKWVAATNTFSRISIPGLPSGASPLSDITVTYVGGTDIRINYKGSDNRLHVLGLNADLVTFWHAYVTPTATPLAQNPGSYVSTDDAYYFIGADNKIHRFYYVSGSFTEDPWFASYTYSGAEVPIGNIAYDPLASRIIYFGADGRLQYFQQAYSTATSSWYWYHAWIDDYWNTYQFSTNYTMPSSWYPGTTTPYWSPSLSVCPGSSTYMYNGDCQFPFSAGNTIIDETKNLRYFSYEPCEILNPPCSNDWDTWHDNWSNLRRPANIDTSTGAVLTAGDIDIFPNPATDKIMINYSGNVSGQLEINIADMNGKDIFAESVSCKKGLPTRYEIDIQAFPKGVYLVSFTLNHQKVTRKITKM